MKWPAITRGRRTPTLTLKSAAPVSAEVAFSYGNFLMRNGNYPEAYEELRQAVRSDPKLLPLAISRTWRALENVDQLNQILPVTSDAYLQAVDFFASSIRWSRL